MSAEAVGCPSRAGLLPACLHLACVRPCDGGCEPGRGEGGVVSAPAYRGGNRLEKGKSPI